MWYGLDMYDCDVLVNKTYTITSWLYNLVEVTATFLCLHTSRPDRCRNWGRDNAECTHCEGLASQGATFDAWSQHLLTWCMSSFNIYQVESGKRFLVVLQLGVQNPARSWRVRRHVAPKAEKNTVESSNVRIHGSSQTCFLCISLPLQDNNSIDILI